MKWSGSYLFAGKITIHPNEKINFQANFFFITKTEYTFTTFQEFLYAKHTLN